MGIDFGKLLGDAVKEVTGFVDRASKDITKAIDQNGDGKLDISDIQTVLDRNQAAQAENQRKADLERLKPVFQEDFKEDEFVLPKMVQVAVIDKAHADSAACKGSVGYKSVMDDMTVVTIFRENIDDFGLTFYPELGYTLGHPAPELAYFFLKKPPFFSTGCAAFAASWGFIVSLTRLSSISAYSHFINRVAEVQAPAHSPSLFP